MTGPRPALLPVALALALVGATARAQDKPAPLGAAQPAPAPSPPPAGKPPPLGAPPTAAGPAPGPAGKPLPLGVPPAGAPPALPAPRGTSSGTGFVVAPGRLLTNHHVAEGCREMRARTAAGTELPAGVIAADEAADLALLGVRGGDPGPPLPFRDGPPVRRGEAVLTYGFPLSGLLSSGPTLTTGDVSALAGLADNPRQFQVSAPVQPGNSGGPLLDLGGNVVGVVVSKLNAQRVAARTGDIPQNVNFAVKGAEALRFLRANGVAPLTAETGRETRGAAEVGETVHPSVVFLRCLR